MSGSRRVNTGAGLVELSVNGLEGTLRPAEAAQPPNESRIAAMARAAAGMAGGAVSAS